MFMNSRHKDPDIRSAILDPLIDLSESIHKDNHRSKVDSKTTKIDCSRSPYQECPKEASKDHRIGEC